MVSTDYIIALLVGFACGFLFAILPQTAFQQNEAALSCNSSSSSSSSSNSRSYDPFFNEEAGLMARDDDDTTIDLSVYSGEDVTIIPKSRKWKATPTRRQYYVQHPSQKAAKKALRKDRTTKESSSDEVHQKKKMGLPDKRLLVEQEIDLLEQERYFLEQQRDLWGKKKFKKFGKKFKKKFKKTRKFTTSAATKAWNEVRKLKREIEKLKGEIRYLKNDLNRWKQKAGKALTTVAKLPDLIVDKVVNPVVGDIEDATQDLGKINGIAKKVAKGAVSVIKKLDLLPTGKRLAKLLVDGMLDFLGTKNGFCVPYRCMIKKLAELTNMGEIDISNIELYSTDNVKITTAIKPERCITVTDIAFDVDLLDNFLDVFRKSIDFPEIYNKVEKFIKNEMDKIIAFTDEIGQLLDDVEDIVEGAAAKLGLKRHRHRVLMLHTNRTEGTYSSEPITMEEISSIAYEKGLARFKELYGQEVKRVYHERDLKKKALHYIGFKAFKLKLSQNFGQTLTMDASHRTGYSDALFDEAMHQEQRVPVPFTGGMVNVLVTGSIEGSMPYSVSLDASAKATFGYDMGAAGVEVDMVEGKMDFFKEDFKPIVNVTAEVGISGSTSLNFAASVSLGICVGPDDDACVIVTLDANQKAAAGFDALAGLNLESTALTAMYAKDIEYKNKKSCNKELALSAGYWMYVKEPHVTLSITGKSPCDETSATLFEVGGGYLVKHAKQFCIDTDIM